jgi:hypothetical protein
MQTIRLTAIKPVRLFGHIIVAGEICEASIPTARELVRSGRAKPVDPSDMALLLDDARLSMGPRTTLRRQR